MALENSKVENYVTEKIVEPMVASTIPIYWGDPCVGNEFNKSSFIDFNDYHSISSAIRAIRDIDNDSGRYLEMLKAPKLRVDQYIDWNERVSEFLCGIAVNMQRQRCDYGYQMNLYNRAVLKSFLFKYKMLRKMSEICLSIKY